MLFVHVSRGFGVWIEVGRLCPPVCNDILTSAPLVLLALSVFYHCSKCLFLYFLQKIYRPRKGVRSPLVLEEDQLGLKIGLVPVLNPAQVIQPSRPSRL